MFENQPSPPLAMARPRKRALALCSAAALGLLGVLALRGSPFGGAEPPPEPTLTEARAQPPAVAPVATRRPVVGRSPMPPRRVAPVIERIEVDKHSVCRGELNFARVIARTLDQTDEHLRITMTGLDGADEGGRRIPFRLGRSQSPEQMPLVTIHGKGGTMVSARVPPVEVKDCAAAAELAIDVRSSADSKDTLRLIARPLQAPADSADHLGGPVFDWDFGDGTKAVGTSAEVSHSYETRPHSTRYAYFLVTVTARDARGTRWQGARSVSFVNFGFRALERDDKVLLFAASTTKQRPTSGEPEVVRLYHGYREPVRIEQVSVRDIHPGDASTEPAKETLSADALGVREIGPGEVALTRDLSRYRPKSPEVVRVFELAGHSLGGKLATGEFSVRFAAEPSTAPATALNEFSRLSNEEVQQR